MPTGITSVGSCITSLTATPTRDGEPIIAACIEAKSLSLLQWCHFSSSDWTNINAKRWWRAYDHALCSSSAIFVNLVQ